MSTLPKIKFSQLLASVKEDLHKYADEGLIDSTRLIKVVRRCNDVLGISIYDRKQCVVDVEEGRADLPLDFYKMEMAFAVGNITVNSGPINPNVKKEYVVHKPACLCDGGTTVCVYPVHQPEQVIKYTTFTPLIINGDTTKLTSYSPNWNWKSQYQLDLQEDVIKVGFAKGQIFLSYLADLVDPETGELLVPFHSRLNDYYEYSVKAKILEDMMVNTEAEVRQAWIDAKRERNLSYGDAVDFVTSKSYTKWKELANKREREFHAQYYSMF